MEPNAAVNLLLSGSDTCLRFGWALRVGFTPHLHPRLAQTIGDRAKVNNVCCSSHLDGSTFYQCVLSLRLVRWAVSQKINRCYKFAKILKLCAWKAASLSLLHVGLWMGKENLRRKNCCLSLNEEPQLKEMIWKRRRMLVTWWMAEETTHQGQRAKVEWFNGSLFRLSADLSTLRWHYVTRRRPQ